MANFVFCGKHKTPSCGSAVNLKHFILTEVIMASFEKILEKVITEPDAHEIVLLLLKQDPDLRNTKPYQNQSLLQ